MNRVRRVARTDCRGFTIIEVLCAAVILVAGMLALLALAAKAVSVTQNTQQDQIAKQKAREAIEAVYSARNDSLLAFDSIRNISNGGVFKDGFQSLYLPGSNGIVGTGQDTSTLDRILLPGPDGLLNTSDDTVFPLTNFQRQILLEPVLNSDNSVNPDLRKITVTVRITSAGRGSQDYTLTGFVSRFR